MSTEEAGFVHVTAAGRSAATRGVAVVPEDEDEERSVAAKATFPGVVTLPPRNPTFLQGLDDLTHLSYLHEASILHNLRLRYAEDRIYTYTGRVCLALNPWRVLPEVYGRDKMDGFLHAQVDGDVMETSEGPHVYGVAQMAYRRMLQDGRSQSLLVSGESGSGKTESCKHILDYLTVASSSSSAADLTARILASNPLLEAFGNAQTARNNNSSRFGKFTEVQFDGESIIGAHIDTYLLEKSRIVSQGAADRNFHIFYQLTAGADAATLAALHLDAADASFAYLSRAALTTIDDEADFAETVGAMDAIGIDAGLRAAVFRTLAAILHLGNVTFEDTSNGEAGKGGSRPTEGNAASSRTRWRLR